MTTSTCGEAVISLLEAYGVDTVFGMPGVHTLELYKGLATSNIQHVLVRHEQGAGFMADGYARASGRPGVCVLITGPGVTNAATPMGQAYSDSVPMLVLSSENARADLKQGRGRLHEITSQEAVTTPLTTFSKTAMSASDVPYLLGQAFRAFASQRPRPVHISLPLDVLSSPADFEMSAHSRAILSAPHATGITAAASKIVRAKRLVIIAGGGTVDCGPALRRLVEQSRAATIVTNAAKGVLPDDHPQCLGATLSSPQIQKFIATADLVLAIGTELAETDSWVDRLTLPFDLVRIDIDQTALHGDYTATVGIVSDAGQAMQAIVECLGNRNPESNITQAELQELRQTVKSDLSPLQQQHVKVLATLRDALPHNGIVSTDMTQIAYTGGVQFPCYQPRTWFHPNGFGTLGYALPAAIGAKVAMPEHPVSVLVGDAGILFTVQELATAVDLALPIPIILWNNVGLGQIRDDMIAQGIGQIGVTPGRNPDYQALARAFGCHARRPESLDELNQTIRDAHSADAPTLIEIRQEAAYLC